MAMLLAASSAAPIPCRIRKAISMGRLVAKPHSAEPRTNTRKAAVYRSLRPIMSASRPKIGRNDANVRMYPTATQLTVLSGAVKSRSSRGSSICVMLASTWPMKAPMHAVPMTNQRYDARRATASRGGGSRPLSTASRSAAIEPGPGSTDGVIGWRPPAPCRPPSRRS